MAHGIVVWRPFSILEKWAIRRTACVICVSEFTRNRIIENSGLPRSQTTVIPNALDPVLAPCGPPQPPQVPPVVLAVSRMSAAEGYKGIDHLIAAMPSVLDAVPSCRLRIVGRGDGLSGMQALVRRLGLSQCVDFAGYLSDRELKGEFDRCSIFALPSEKEGFGVVYLEAMSHGRPCIGARSGGVPEVITEETGELVRYGMLPAFRRRSSARWVGTGNPRS